MGSCSIIFVPAVCGVLKAPMLTSDLVQKYSCSSTRNDVNKTNNNMKMQHKQASKDGAEIYVYHLIAPETLAKDDNRL